MNIRVCDVGPRDGLQNHPVALAPPQRAELCRRLAAAGLRHIEAVSFVRADRVPHMAGAEDVLMSLPPTATWSALVLNELGYDRAEKAGVREIHVAVMATETFSARNCNMSVDAGIAAATAITSRAHQSGGRVAATVSAAFGCPYEGRVDSGSVLKIAGRLVEAGADELMLADTIGCAVPRQVTDLLDRASTFGVPIGVHLHNTRNAGYANALTAIEHGATILEASVGGIGGCPYAPAATGNVATEDLINLLHAQGIRTGIDLEALIDVANWLETTLGTPVPGLLHRAGTFPSPPSPLTEDAR